VRSFEITQRLAASDWLLPFDLGERTMPNCAGFGS